MSDAQDPLFTIANLLDVPLQRVRQVVAAARAAHPEGTDEEVRQLAFETIRREVRQASLDAARKSVGR